MLSQKDKELTLLKNAEKNFEDRIQFEKKQSIKKDQKWNKTLEKEAEMKEQIMNKLNNLKNEMKGYEESEGMMAQKWKSKFKDLYDITIGLANENSILIKQIKLLQTNIQQQQYQSQSDQKQQQQQTTDQFNTSALKTRNLFGQNLDTSSFLLESSTSKQLHQSDNKLPSINKSSIINNDKHPQQSYKPQLDPKHDTDQILKNFLSQSTNLLTSNRQDSSPNITDVAAAGILSNQYFENKSYSTTAFNHILPQSVGNRQQHFGSDSVKNNVTNLQRKNYSAIRQRGHQLPLDSNAYNNQSSFDLYGGILGPNIYSQQYLQQQQQQQQINPTRSYSSQQKNMIEINSNSSIKIKSQLNKEGVGGGNITIKQSESRNNNSSNVKQTKSEKFMLAGKAYQK